MLDASFVRSSSPKKAVDPEAGVYGRQHKENACGYKMHTAVDRKSGWVRRVIITPANVNDTTPVDDLVMGDEKAVYADKAYDKRARRKALEERGIFAGIMHRPNQYHPLKPAQTAFNKRMTKLRSPVEHVFGILKNHYRCAQGTTLYRIDVDSGSNHPGLHGHEYKKMPCFSPDLKEVSIGEKKP